MKIYKEIQDDTIPVRDMKDGQIGIITEWDVMDHYGGRIIQRWGDKLIAIGEGYGKSFDEITKDVRCRVCILPKGTLLEI